MKWYPYGGSDISGEYRLTGGYYAEIKHGMYNHNYMLSLKENSAFKFGEKGWRLFISMGTNCMHMGNIIDMEFSTLKEAKEFAETFIKEYDDSVDALDRIEYFKMERCKPVFDMDLNYVGNDYVGTICYKHKDYNYYNDKPIDYDGKHYVLDIVQDKLVLRLITCYPCVQGGETVDNKELALQLLDKTCEIKSKYVDRFRAWRNEHVKKRIYSGS